MEGDPTHFDFEDGSFFGALLQYPGTDGFVNPDMESIIERLREKKIQTIVATDLLALCLLKPPGEMGADIAIGSSQRFGVPIGFGGPHAAFISVARKTQLRRLPGRIVGVSHDRRGIPAYRLTLQSREQHIRREKASSNICTAQALLANVAAAYAIYHGPKGLKQIAKHTHFLAKTFETLLESQHIKVVHNSYFDTVCVRFDTPYAETLLTRAKKNNINIRKLDDYTVVVSFDETHSLDDVKILCEQFLGLVPENVFIASHIGMDDKSLRTSRYLEHETFNRFQSETEMMRYLYKLQKRDMGLADSMIPLGSCTMKLNAAAEMIPISWLNVNKMHPFAPVEQTKGYEELFYSLEKSLAALCGLDAVSLQPNAGATGEYCGLRAIQAYHEAAGEKQRKVCLIPESAHGTNPASAKMAGMQVVIVSCTEDGYINMEDLKAKLDQHSNGIAAMMLTYVKSLNFYFPKNLF